MFILDQRKSCLLEGKFSAEDLVIVVGARDLHALASALLAVVSNHDHIFPGAEALSCLVLALLAMKLRSQITSIRILSRSSSL